MNTTKKEGWEEYRVKEEKALRKTEQPLDVAVWSGLAGGAFAKSSEGAQKYGVVLAKTEDRLFQEIWLWRDKWKESQD